MTDRVTQKLKHAAFTFLEAVLAEGRHTDPQYDDVIAHNEIEKGGDAGSAQELERLSWRIHIAILRK